jgi:hypothetical protein
MKHSAELKNNVLSPFISSQPTPEVSKEPTPQVSHLVSLNNQVPIDQPQNDDVNPIDKTSVTY